MPVGILLQSSLVNSMFYIYVQPRNAQFVSHLLGFKNGLLLHLELSLGLEKSNANGN